MSSTIGVGVVGLSATGNWGAVAHWPAIEAVPGVRLRGLTAGSPESTAAAAKRFGVPGYTSVAEMASREEIDLIAITVRVPEHRRLLEPVLESGKAVLCEWPLARDLTEAEFLRDAGRPGPRFTGLQGHVSPTTRWVRDLIADGYVGEVLSSSMICSFPGGGVTFTSASAYTADAANGATMMTIPFAHALDMQAVVLGELTAVTATVATVRTQAVNTDTGETIAKTAPDQIAVTGRLPGGAVAGMHFRGGALRTTPFAWEIDGTRGSLRITGDVGLPMSATLAVEGAHDQEALSPLELPAGYDRFPELAGTPAHNVAHLYAEVAEALSGRDSAAPTFEYAVELHRSFAAIAHRGTEE
ncbi:Gfo/Idh/MocA family protein [Streptomyces fagopyri]